MSTVPAEALLEVTASEDGLDPRSYKSLKSPHIEQIRLSVAPMMDWTDY